MHQNHPKLKTEYSAKLISCMFRNITMLFPSLQKIPTFFTNPLLHLVESLPPITAKYSSDKTEKRENLGILNTDHILQGDCLIWCCWFECNYTYESQFKMDIINNLAKGKLSLSICHGFSMKMIIIKVCHLSSGCHHNNHTLHKKKS